MGVGYIYNAFDDTTFRFGGREFNVPKGQVTVIADQIFESPDHAKRNAESDPEPNAMLSYTISGLNLVKTWMNQHRANRHAMGFWAGDRDPSDNVKKEASMRARQYKTNQVLEAKKERAGRMANAPGRIEFDDCVIRWMSELGIEDDYYSPGSGIDDKLLEKIGAAAGAAAARILQSQAAKGQAAKA